MELEPILPPCTAGGVLDDDDDEQLAYNTLEELHATELTRCKLSEKAGNITAVLDAIIYCKENSLRAPDWLLDAIFHLAADAITGRGKRRGRGGNLLANYRYNLVHTLRYDVVEEVRDKQVECSEQIASLKAGGSKADLGRLADREAMQSKIGRTLDDAFSASSELLSGGFAAGGEETIKTSYYKVRDGELGEFKFPSAKTLRALGLADALKGKDPYVAFGLAPSPTPPRAPDPVTGKVE